MLHLLCCGDSQLVIDQITCSSSCNNPELFGLWKAVLPTVSALRRFTKPFPGYSDIFQWIPRDLNSRADELAGYAMKNQTNVSFLDPEWDLDVLSGLRRLYVRVTFDGSCSQQRMGGCGFSICVGRSTDDLAELYAGARFLGSRSTNNTAEYQGCHFALLASLDFAKWCYR